MLTQWIFVLLIDGQSLKTFPSDTEASCKQVMAQVLTNQHDAGKKASGACYIRTADLG